MGLLAAGDLVNIEPPNLPPTWSRTPNPSFVAGVGGTYDLKNDCVDPEGDSRNFALNGGSAALPTGVSLSSDGVLTATTAVTEATTTGIIVDVDDGINPAVASPSFSIVVSDTVTDQELRDMGYLLADDFSGVDPTGVGDSTSGLNEFFLEMKRQFRPGWLSVGATYRITDTLRMGMWDSGDSLQLYGGGDGANKPEFVLDNGATGFGDSGTPRPVLCVRLFQKGAADEEWPSDPMDESGNFVGQANVVFYLNLSNFSIDCGTNSGAFGIYSPAAQRCFANDIDIDCSNAYGGWWGLLGRNSPIMNLSITGGEWQIRNNSSSRTAEGTSGSIICGLELIGDASTTTPIETNDSSPLTIVGFDITRTTSGSFWDSSSHGRTGYSNLTLIDGIVNSAGGTAFVNDEEKNLYIRNVYVTGTDNLVQSGTNPVQTGTGTWKLINEYVTNDPTTTNAGSGQYTTRSMIDGVLSTAVEPIVDISNSVSAPTVDYIARHSITVPRPDSSAYINIVDEGATVNPDGLSNLISNDDTADSLTAINNAITNAQTAGHNTVLVPRGSFYVSGPVDLLANTKFIGVGFRMSLIIPRDTWQPTSQAYVIRSADSASGTAHLSNVAVYTRTVDGSFTSPNGPYQFDWFSFINWRTGRNSSTIQPYNAREFMAPQNECHPKNFYNFENNAGGKHFSLTDCQGRRFGNTDCRSIRVANTSEPLHLYGCNVEITKQSVEDADTNIEIENSSNVRLYNCKREGSSGTILINDSTNIAFYGLGKQDADAVNYICRIQGTSDDITIAMCVFDSTGASSNGNDMIGEYIDLLPTQTIEWPEGCSVYKRGTLNDSAATI